MERRITEKPRNAENDGQLSTRFSIFNFHVIGEDTMESRPWTLHGAIKYLEYF